MPIRTRFRRLLLWATSGLFMLLTSFWAGSGFFTFGWSRWDKATQPETITDFYFTRGGITYSVVRGPSPLDSSTLIWDAWKRENAGISFWDMELKSQPDIAVRLPLWLPLLILTAPMLWLWRSEQIAKRRDRDLCIHCGYNLHALPSTSPCPECGKSHNMSSNP